jgi:hypothetical protein
MDPDGKLLLSGPDYSRPNFAPYPVSAYRNYLKGQCHEIMVEIRPQSTKAGLN